MGWLRKKRRKGSSCDSGLRDFVRRDFFVTMTHLLECRIRMQFLKRCAQIDFALMLAISLDNRNSLFNSVCDLVACSGISSRRRTISPKSSRLRVLSKVSFMDRMLNNSFNSSSPSVANSYQGVSLISVGGHGFSVSSFEGGGRLR